MEPALHGLAQSKNDRSQPLLRSGNTNCGGCGMSIVLNMLSRGIGEHPVQVVIPACCGIVTAGPFPWSAYGAPVVASTFAAAAAVATGLARSARMNGEPTRVMCFAGDGGTYDIGMATVSAAAERNEDILYVCYDNESYGNTGGQRSSATPPGARTSTTPGGKVHQKKDILSIMAAHRVPYAASVSLGHPEDTVAKFKRALGTEGFRFLHVLSPCPTGWKSEPAEGIALVRMAVRSGLYPVLQIEDGRRVTIDITPDFDRKDLERYFAGQGRFRGDRVDIDAVEKAIRENWIDLRRRAAGGGER